MAEIDKEVIWTSLFGQAVPVPQHEGKDGSPMITGENNPLPMKILGGNVEEQLTQADAVGGTLTFDANIKSIGIFNRDTVNDGIFNVNGIDITVPPETPFEANIGGTPRATVTVTGSTSYIVTRYV